MTTTTAARNGSLPPSEIPQLRSEINVRSLSTHRVPRHLEIPALPKYFLRHILGLNPFKASYFSLYRPLKDIPSQAAVIVGVLCAITAGVPLPIIGIIFGKLIDGFPPTEDDLATKLTQLLVVGKQSNTPSFIYSRGRSRDIFPLDLDSGILLGSCG
jgi:ATP-binding cassette, subfamily B (MDR/TAP), member 1